MADSSTRIIISAVDAATPVLQRVSSSMMSLSGAADLVKSSLGAVGAGLSVAAFANAMNAAIEYGGKLNDMAMQTGATVEQLSALRNAAEMSGVSLDEAGKGLAKLSRLMLGAATGNKESLGTFKALGVEVTTATGALRDSGDVMLEVAKSISALESPTERVAAAQMAFGKTGAQLVPMLMDLAKQNELVATWTAKDAAAADEFGDSLTQLKQHAREAAEGIARDLIPALNASIKNFNAARSAGYGFVQSLTGIGVRGMTDTVDDARAASSQRVSELRAALEENQAKLDSFSGEKYSDAWYELVGNINNATKQLKYYKALQADVVAEQYAASYSNEGRGAKSPSFSAMLAEQDAEEQRGKRATENAKRWAAESAQIDAERYSQRIKALQAATDHEKSLLDVAHAAGVTDEAQYQADLYAATTNGIAQRMQAVRQQLDVTSDPKTRAKLAGDLEELNAAAVKAADGYALSLAKMAKAERDFWVVGQQEATRAAAEQAATLQEKARAAEDEIALIGKGADEIAKLVEARYDEQIAQKRGEIERKRGIEGLEGEIGAIEAQIDALTRLKNAEVARPQLEAQAREWENFSRDIESSLTDALYRSFESGKGFGESFADSLEATFKSMVLKYAVQYIVNGAGQIIGAVAGGDSGGGGLSWNSATSGASLVSSGYQAYVGYTTGTGSGMAGAAGNWLGGYGLSGITYGSGVAVGAGGGSAAVAASEGAAGFVGPPSSLATGSAAANTGGAAGSGSAGSSASLWWLAMIVGMYLNGEAWQSGNPRYRIKNYTNEDKPAGYDYLTSQGFKGLYDVDKAIFGEGWADSKLRSTLLGDALHLSMQDAIWGTGWQGDGRAYLRGSASFSGVTDTQLGVGAHKEGGWFHSDRDKIDWSAPEQALTDAMDGIYQAISNSVAMLGATFDDKSLIDKVKAFSYDFNIQLTDAMKVDGAGLLTGIGESFTTALVKEVLPAVDLLAREGETTATAFTRLVGELELVSDITQTLGKRWTGVVNDMLGQADALVNLFGGTDQLNSAFGSYFDAFYSSAEKQERATRNLTVQFDALNLTMPTTKEGFRDLVEGLDLTTTSGQETFATLMTLAPAFVMVSDAATAAAQKWAGFDAAGLSKMMLDAAFNPADGMTAAESFAAALEQSVRNALISSTVGSIAQNIYNAIVVPMAAGAAVSTAAIDGVVAHAQEALNTMGAVLAQLDLSAITDAAASILPGLSAYAPARTVTTSYVQTTAAAERQAVAQAASQIKGEWQRLADSIVATIREMRGEIVDDAANFAQEKARFAIATAQARAGDQNAAQLLPALARSVVDLGKSVTSTATEQALLTAQTLASLRSTVDAIGTKYGIKVPAFAIGTNFVPADMLAQIHKGERVIPAADNRAIMAALDGSGDVVTEVKALRAEFSRMREESSAQQRAIAKHTLAAAKTLERVTPDGDALATRAAA